jgi:hypothetical protein
VRVRVRVLGWGGGGGGGRGGDCLLFSLPVGLVSVHLGWQWFCFGRSACRLPRGVYQFAIHGLLVSITLNMSFVFIFAY